MFTRRRLFQTGLLAGLSFTLPSCASLYRPFAREKLASAGALSSNSGKLQAGFSRIEITPDVTNNFIPMAGYGEWKMLFRSRQAKSISDKIFTRATVLDNGYKKIALVNADILIISNELKTAVAEKIKNLGINDFLLAGTHAHSSIGGYIDNEFAEVMAMGHYQKKIFSFLVEKISEAIIIANANLVPAKIGSQKINISGYNQNRRIKDGPIDPELGIIRIDNSENSPLGYIVNFAAHPTTLGPVDFISGDYPGFFQTSLEEKGGTAIFFNGACGDLRSAYPGPTPTNAYQKAEFIGKDLALRVAQLSQKIKTKEEIKINTLNSNILLPYIDLYGSSACLHPISEFFLPFRTPLQVISLDNHIIAAFPCDLGVEIGLNIKEQLINKECFIVSYANDYMGYVLPKERYLQGGYEANMSFYGTKVEEIFVNEILRMINLLPVSS